MPSSNRLYQLAVGGCLAAVLAFGTIPALGENDEETQTPKPAAKQEQPAVTPPPPYIPEPKKEPATEQQKGLINEPCAEPKDLCQQFRMANAAENQLTLLAKQNDLISYEIAALVLTLGATAWAARSASKAAAAAEDALTKAQRPYVFALGVKDVLPAANKNQDGYIPYTVTNYGQTPAIIEFIGALPSLGQTPKAPNQENGDHPLVVSPILETRERRDDLIAEPTFWIDSGIHLMPITKNEYGEILPTFPNIPAGKSLFFWVKITYRGPFTKGHETSACWRYDTEVCQFIRYGGEEYNYTR